MKKIILAIGLLFLVSCVETLIEKPKRLLTEQQMEDILYDYSILQAINYSDKSFFEERQLDPIQLIYQWYDIDSLTYVSNDVYYASKPKIYAAIYKKVDDRLTADKKIFEEEFIEFRKKEKEKLDSIRQAKVDSLDSVSQSGIN